MKSRQKK